MLDMLLLQMEWKSNLASILWMLTNLWPFTIRGHNRNYSMFQLGTGVYFPFTCRVKCCIQLIEPFLKKTDEKKKRNIIHKTFQTLTCSLLQHFETLIRSEHFKNESAMRCNWPLIFNIFLIPTPNWSHKAHKFSSYVFPWSAFVSMCNLL